MGLGGISPWQLLILLAIVLAIFGTKKLRNIGGDLGSAMRDFRGAMREDDDKEKDDTKSDEDDRVVEQQDGASVTTQTRNSSEAKTKETAKETAENSADESSERKS